MENKYPVLGIDVGGHNIKAGWVKGGEVWDFQKIPVEPANILKELKEVINDYKKDEDYIIGLGFPGFVGKERVLNPPNLPTIKDVNLKKEVQDETGLPVYIVNDADAVILGEALYGCGKGYNIVAGFTLGTGVGGGIIVEGEIYRGVRGYAAEFGHMIIDADGPICKCGKRGCLEAFIGSHGIEKRYRNLTGAVLSVKEIFEKLKEKDRAARQIVKEFGYYLGIGIKNIIEILDPDLIVLAGGVSKSGSVILDSIERNQPYDTYFPVSVDIKVAELGDRAGPIGVAHWARSEHYK